VGIRKRENGIGEKQRKFTRGKRNRKQ